jgi:hypothetical protein
MTADAKIHGNSKMAAEIEAKKLGREGGPDALTSRGGSRRASEPPRKGQGASEDGTDGPPQPVSRTSKEDRSRLCMCACGTRTKGDVSPLVMTFGWCPTQRSTSGASASLPTNR